MYNITFQNGFTLPVALEVRSGSSASCDQNVQQYNQSLNAHDSYLLTTDDVVVCWRRTADPDNPSQGYTSWNTFEPNDINTPTTIDISTS